MAGIDTYTKLCLHLDEDPNFLDSSDSNHTITKVAGADRSAAQSEFGGYSAYFDGVSGYLSISDSSDWAFGTGDFTIDFWINFESVIVSEIPFSQHTAVQFYKTGTNVNIYISGPGHGGYGVVNGMLIADALSVDTWYHLALVRNGSSFKGYQNGQEKGSATSALAVEDSLELLNIGGYNNGSSLFTGYIDELRISKGIARWTEPFTPPTEAYTGTFKVKGTKSETSRIIVFDESDWSIEVNTVVSGSGAYEAEVADTGDRTVLARANDGELLGFGGITPIEE